MTMTAYSPLNTPIDGDRDYYDLKGFYQSQTAPNPLGTLHMRQLPTGGYTLLGLEGCGCGCNGAPGGCGMGQLGAEEASGLGKAWIPFVAIAGIWALFSFGPQIAEALDPASEDTKRRRRKEAADVWSRW